MLYREYAALLKALIAQNARFIRAVDFLDDKSAFDSRFVLIKHDVEAKPAKALKVAKTEKKLNVFSTFYIHSFFLDGRKKYFKTIMGYGHEIGYHYDVLDNNNGDFAKALEEFIKTLDNFKHNDFVIRTLCPHGNPLKIRHSYESNQDFFRNPDIARKFGDLFDIYVQMPELKKDYLYVTDAGYGFKYKKAGESDDTFITLNGTKEILDLFNQGNSMVISIHSHRFFGSRLVFAFRTLVFKTLKKAGQVLNKTKLGKKLIDRFYFLAKKI